MPGGDGVEAERDRPVRERGELDLLVAAQARVGRLARGVGGDEVLDHVLLELLREIPNVEGDSEHVGGAAGVAGVLLGAASARPRAQRVRRLRQREVYPDDVVARPRPRGKRPRRNRRRRSSRRARASEVSSRERAAHRRQPRGLRALDHLRERSQQGVYVRRVEVWPSENRSDPRASPGPPPSRAARG